jgi:hypothetical protein
VSKFKAVHRPPCGTSKQLDPNPKVQISGKEYVTLFNAFASSLVDCGETFRIGSFEDIPAGIKVYQDRAAHYREAGDTARYYLANQASVLLKKLEIPINKKACEKATLDEWYKSEAHCKETNRQLLEAYKRPYSGTPAQRDLMDLVWKVRAEITSLVGGTPPSVRNVAHHGRFGPGVTMSHGRENLDPIFKTFNPSCYVGSESMVGELLSVTKFREAISRAHFESRFATVSDTLSMVRWTDENLFASVPKTVSINRSIAVEPSLAVFLQSAYDGHLRSLLKTKWGIDLRDQRPNRRLARIGSELGNSNESPCTIDLTSASDRIAFGLIAMCFPRQWFDTLHRLRSRKTLMEDGESVTLEKFSSMGNALTFSLQTILFGAVVRSVLRDRGLDGAYWRAYGDDIIVPRDAFDEVVYRLELLGMEPNIGKSFSEGNFRESCGCDYLLGTDVRPLYIKKPIRTVMDIYKYLNLVQVQVSKAPIPGHFYAGLYSILLQWVPKTHRVFGRPSRSLDGYIWAPVRSLPKRILREAQRTTGIPPEWGYLRRLYCGGGRNGGSWNYDPPLDNEVATGDFVKVSRLPPNWGALADFREERMLNALVL